MPQRNSGRIRLQHPVVLGILALSGAAIATTATAMTAVDQSSGFPMNEEVRTKVRTMRTVAISPDSSKVLVNITDATADGGLPHLWLLGKGMKPRQLTFSRPGESGGETAGQFSPDGTAILFVATRDGTQSLFRLPLSGGEPERLQIGKDATGAVSSSWGGARKTNATSAGGYAFSPDGKHLAFWGSDPEPAAVKARKERKDDGYSFGEKNHRKHLYLLDPVTGAARAVKLDGSFSEASWSYDGADMIVTTDEHTDETGPDITTWKVTPDLAVTRLDLPKTATAAAYLPGRKRMAYVDDCAGDVPPGCVDLFVKDFTTGTVRNLTKGFDGAIPHSFVVLPSGDVVGTIATHTRSRIAKISTADGAVDWIDIDLPMVADVVTNPDRSGWAMVGMGPTNSGTVLTRKTLAAAAMPLESPALVPAHWSKVPSKLITYQNEGLTIEALLYMPQVVKGTKVPLVVQAHGGPAGRFADTYSNLTQMLVAEGWAVLQPNVRGSGAYGTKFLVANRNDLGGGDFRDVMAGVDAVLKDYPVDEKRMALIGFSYGGEMAGFALGKTDRFKAIVSAAPVIDQISEYGTQWATLYDRWYVGKPWLNFANAWRQSPLSTVANAKTPFLLLHGAEDSADPLGQSREMFRALKQTPAPVALIVYPREGHGDTGKNFGALPSTEPWHGVDLRRRMFGFIRSAFAGDTDPLAVARKDIP